MKVIKGDLIKLAKAGEFDVIVHGCNCFCNMGAGIAATIAQEFPAAYKADKWTIYGDKDKLGEYSLAIITKNLVVVNAYTQFSYGGGQINADYDAIRKVFARIAKDFSQWRIAYPKIGAGLAGGNWDIISKIIDEELDGCNHTLVEYVP